MNKSSPKNRWSHRLCIALTAGAAFFGAVTMSQAQTVTTSITNNFDAANSATGWTYWYDAYNGMYNSIILDWDGTMNNGGAAGSGSVLFTNLWAGHTGGEQCQIWGTFAHTGGSQYDFSQTIDGTKYDTITFDVHANADAPTNTQGNICRLNVGFFVGFSGSQLGGSTNVNIPTSATNGWYHVVAAVNKADPGLSTFAVGWAFNINCYGGPNGNLPGSANNTYLWIDNIQVNRSKTVTPPPTMSPAIVDATPGLNLIFNNQYDRTSLSAVQQTGRGWIGQPDTTYSFTIQSFPSGATYPNNQAHIFVGTPNGASSMDYNTPNLVWLNVQGNADGTATTYFRYKINEPGSNTNMFGANFTNGTAWAGQLAALNASSPTGTWSMTFDQDTNVTLNGPGGATTSFSIDPAVAAQFADPMQVLFGAQPNNSPPATGQAVILSHASVSNSASGSLLDDDFIADNGALNTALWAISAASSADLQLFPVDPGQKLVKWTIPDTSFGLQVATSLLGPWTALSGSGAVTSITNFSLNGFHVGLVPSANLGPNQNYFRMFTPKFAKLQLLMPGETAAPGTATGKTGTPDPQSISTPFNVVVNAVDANWNLAAYNSDHTIQITSTDGTATLPANAALAGATATFSVTFGTSGTFTVTATDVTDGTKTANTGSPTLAQ
jgi:hypothetical protein